MIRSTVAMFALLAALSASARAESASRVIKCEGPFARTATHADVVKAFGSRNVVYTDVDGAEGEKIKATVIYPKVPKDRLELIWNEARARRHPWMRVWRTSTWTASNGIGLGKPLADIEAMNGKAFTISGFDWDYGGRVVDWNGGALDKPLPGGCRISLSFDHPDDAPEEALSRVLGDTNFMSDNPDMRAVKPFVSLIAVSYPRQ